MTASQMFTLDFWRFLSPATTAKNPTNQKRGYEISRVKDAHHVESTDTTPLWYRGKKNPSVTTLEHHDKSPAILVVCNQQKSSKVLPIWGICKLVSSLFVAEGVVVVFITKHAIGWVRRN